jgi:hypothetical protein
MYCIETGAENVGGTLLRLVNLDDPLRSWMLRMKGLKLLNPVGVILVALYSETRPHQSRW